MFKGFSLLPKNSKMNVYSFTQSKIKLLNYHTTSLNKKLDCVVKAISHKNLSNKVYLKNGKIFIYFLLSECLVCDSAYDFMECINPDGVAGKSTPCTKSTSDCYSRVVGKNT